MSYFDIIQNVVHYIDDNLTKQLNADVLADVAGFSTYHFCCETLEYRAKVEGHSKKATSY